MKKILMYIAAILLGPLMVLCTLTFYSWSVIGGLCTMCVVSFLAVKNIWDKGDKNKVIHSE